MVIHVYHGTETVWKIHAPAATVGTKVRNGNQIVCIVLNVGPIVCTVQEW